MTTPTFTPSPTETATEVATPSYKYELTSEQLDEKKLVGSGFELKTEFRGIPVDFTVVTTEAELRQYKQTRGCMPNQEMSKSEYGPPAEDRMAEMVLLGHYVGYLRYTGLTETGYPFSLYLADLKKPEANRSYSIWGPKSDGIDGEWMVDPRKPVEYVVTNTTVDPDGNGRGTALLNDNASRRGFQQLENGGLRIVQVNKFVNPDYFKFCVASSEMDSAFLSLGVTSEFLQGRIQLILPTSYPTAQARLNALIFNRKIYDDSHGLISWTLLAVP
jgi:hypothetical protein